ncbi:phage head closure protein [Rhizobium halophytocola]|uniref:SPP1 family predicted phage head-tail adaptor n=1 Tax=Rhizobium halophytocola TaxID=735519 RepID=A0ABS4DZ04_9HYPH|nr:phage head closure protein [Rhizobium halophytocola]MBP1850910.1 SPP1 family predicted phage head-tail adaptor [Rhizobium halophytocola]
MAGVSLDPGALTARLWLEQPVEMPDGQGGAVVTFEAVASLWCRIEPLAARVEEVAGAETVTVTHRVWLRHRAGIASGMRFRKGLRLFVIRSLRDPDETGRLLLASVEEAGA